MNLERQLTDAIVAVLEGTGLDVGDGEQPSSTGWSGAPGESAFIPYAVLHPISGGVASGPLDGPHDDSEFIFQVSCHGATRAQCQYVADAVDPVMLSFRPTLDGWKVAYVDLDMHGGARRVDTVQPAQFQGVPRYRFYVTPGPALPPGS